MKSNVLNTNHHRKAVIPMQTSGISVSCRGPKAHDDTVHEMARDEARHGKAFKGLLERYFGK
jgi:hypothetical protein